MAINQKTLSRMDELKGISLSDGLFTGVIGVSKIDSSESGNKIEIDDPLTYLIGSLTKIFIADIFYILEKDLNLNLDRKINEFIIIPEKYNKITLKELISHTSGVPNYTTTNEFQNILSDKTTSKESILKIIFSSEIEKEKIYKYSNSNYFLLGIILEHMLVRSLSEILIQYICAPLGLTNTRVVENEEIIGKTIDDNGNTILTKNNSSGIYAFGAGNISSSYDDMVKYFKNLLRKNHNFLERFPWKKNKINNIEYICHGGICKGFQSYFAFSEENNEFILLLSNNDSTLREELIYYIKDENYKLPRSAEYLITKKDKQIIFKSELTKESVNILITNGHLFYLDGSTPIRLYKYENSFFSFRHKFNTRFYFFNEYTKLKIISNEGETNEETENFLVY